MFKNLRSYLVVIFVRKTLECRSSCQIENQMERADCKSQFNSIKQVSNHKNIEHQLKIASLNICRGVYSKEELLESTIRENDLDVCSVCEVDIENFDIKNPFSLRGYQTLFPLERTGTSTKRLICFVKDDIQVSQRSDLMSDMFSSVWLEIRNNAQKILICKAYREFSDLTNKDQLSINQQHERWKIFQSQLDKASKESLSGRFQY